MDWLIWILVAVYALGFLVTFSVNLLLLPVTIGLALLRAAVWPYYWWTGRPEGRPMPMD